MLFCFAVKPSYADLIRYTDQNGTLCFADDLSNVPKKYRQNIIRDEDESAVQVLSDDPSASGEKIVRICMYDTIEKRMGDRHDLTDFLAARGYSYRTLNVHGNPANLNLCAELECKNNIKTINKDRKLPECIKSLAGLFNTGQGLPITYIGEKPRSGTMLDLRNEIDTYFGTDPRTPVQWLD
jgi:hypothetical protein